MGHLFLQDPEEWSLADVASVIEERLPEGQRLEYKRDLKLDSSRQKAELAKDISGLANADGGWLLFGIAEDESEEPLPLEVVGVPAGLQTRLENVLDTVLEPVPSYHAATISLDNERGVVLVRVPPHGGRPVMVQGYEQHRFFLRSGTRTRPMRASEVAAAFARAEKRSERLEARMAGLPLLAPIFRTREADELVARRQGGEAPFRAPIASVVVGAVDCGDELLEPGQLVPEAFPEGAEGYRGAHGIRFVGRFENTAWGLVEETFAPRSQSNVQGRLAIYRAGVVEWARCFMNDAHGSDLPGYSGRYKLPSVTLASEVHDALIYAGHVLQGAKYFGRVGVWVRLDHADHAVLMVARDLDVDVRTPSVAWVGHRCEVGADELANPTPIVWAAMDRVWQAFGLRRCGLFATDGRWL